MGYSHYWEWERVIASGTFRPITLVFSRLILPLQDKGVSLAGPFGDGVAEITEDRIAFNGVADCGHSSHEEICIPHPDENAWGVGNASNAVSGYASRHTLLRHRTRDGNRSYGTFPFDRVQQARFAEDSEGSCSEYCKQAFARTTWQCGASWWSQNTTCATGSRSPQAGRSSTGKKPRHPVTRTLAIRWRSSAWIPRTGW